MKPVRIATVGLANYAGDICRLLQAQSRRDDAPVHLVAAAEINPALHAPTIAALKAEGVSVYEQFAEMIQREDIEAVWLPVPIPLHAPLAVQALRAGKAVMSEKPAAATVDDVDAMIAARDAAGLPVAIGFQTMYDPLMRQLKRQLLGGAIGRIRTIVHHAMGPRGDSYYNRTAWAGKLRCNQQWVLDGPATNAHAHHLNLAMFLAGPGELESAQPLAVEAELYRSNPIASYDTSGMRVELDHGVSVLSLLTHACEYFVQDMLMIVGDRGRACLARDVVVIDAAAGATVLRREVDLHQAMVERFARLVRGMADHDQLYATLENARAQVVAVNGAVQAAPIRDIPDAAVHWIETSQGRTRAVLGMESMVQLCVLRGMLLHESGLFPWTQPAGRSDLRGYHHFAGPASLAGAGASAPRV